jgi:hypothetical protein
MKKANMKKIVLWTSVAILGILAVVDTMGGPQICGIGNLACRTNLEDILTLFYPIPVLFLLSLITYKMRDQVFHAWWVFARWWVPVIIFVTLLLNSAGGGGGYVGMGAAFDGFIYLILYGVLIIVSLVKIVRAHKKK